MDQYAPLRLTLAEMVRGAHRECTVRIEGRAEDGAPRPIDKRVRVRVPAGITPGKRIRLAGMGGEGEPPGDLFLTVELEPDPHFTLDGRNLILRLPVAPWEAALGATVKVSTPHGVIQLKVPAGSQSGRRLRLAGKGLPGQPAGDLLDRPSSRPIIMHPEDVQTLRQPRQITRLLEQLHAERGQLTLVVDGGRLEKVANLFRFRSPDAGDRRFRGG